MKELFQKFARYNESVNREMNGKILAENGNLRRMPSHGYFENIHGILVHVLDVDISWLHDLKQYFPDSPLSDEAIADIPDDRSKALYADLATYLGTRAAVDGVIIELCEFLSLDDYQQKIRFMGKQNVMREKRVWEILSHMFNHQTHHRGQISQFLDEQGIENDYSNIIRIE